MTKEEIRMEILIDLLFYLYEVIDNAKIETSEELTNFAIELHDLIERAVFECGTDKEIYEDYEPSY